MEHNILNVCWLTYMENTHHPARWWDGEWSSALEQPALLDALLVGGLTICKYIDSFS